MTSLATLIDEAASRYGDRPAIVAGPRRLNFREVAHRADLLAAELSHAGVGRGSKVALSCPNVPEFSIAYWAILKVGGVVVPLNVTLRAREIAYHLDNSDAVAYIVHDGPEGAPLVDTARQGFEKAERCHILGTIGAAETDGATTWQGEPLTGRSECRTTPLDDEDTAVIIYTSGTTGQPKGAELTHRNLRTNAEAAGVLYGLDPTRPDTYLLAAPLFHSLAQTCVQNAATAYGCTAVMLRQFAAEAALRAMIDEKVTVFPGVPTMYWALLGALDKVEGADRLKGQLRVAASGGAALPVELRKEFEDRFGTTILEGYGLSETSPVASHAVLGEAPRPGSIGRPIPGVEMKLINDDWSDVPEGPDAVGEIAIKGPNVMKGYYGRPDATSAAIKEGWFRSGDLARKDEDGFYYIVGRLKDLIIRGGYNVYPRELEEVLMEHPAVSLVAVIGVPHPSHGQEIKAIIVKAAGHEDVTEEDLLAWGKEQFASYKYPRIVEFRASLPLTSTGKILKRELS
ncbi:long-chain fatty acid--CoA ligase [Thermopolyspora sp. NPDC052614]|uniref:long-chain-fatty-acid--CoA ligase n=1 Tax=Thermopolyspora sp. NPDC052614 TaxID=3155682 RepID=UPI003412D806